MGFLGALFGLLVVDLGVDANFGLIFAPFSYKELVLIVIKVTALALTLSVDPVSFKMVTVSLGKDTVAVAFSLVPLAFVNVLVSVDHATLALWVSVHPVAVVAVAVSVEEGSTSVAAIFIPVASVFAAELATVISPESALAVLLIHSPHAFIFITIFVVLDTEAFLAVVAPIADVTTAAFPLFALHGAILLLVLLFDPVDGTMSARFVRFQVRTKIGNYFEKEHLHFPVLEEIVLHLLLLALLICLLVVGEPSI